MGDLRFSPGHCWVRIEDDTAVVGLTEYFQDELGDVTSVDLPDVGDEIRMAVRMGRVESETTASPLAAPVSGEVVDVNAEVLDNPDLVNQEPSEAGWLLKVRIQDPAELDDLLTEEEYTEMTTEV